MNPQSVLKAALAAGLLLAAFVVADPKPTVKRQLMVKRRRALPGPTQN